MTTPTGQDVPHWISLTPDIELNCTLQILHNLRIDMGNLTPSVGLTELSLLNAEAKKQSYTDFYFEFADEDWPTEIITRMKDFWEITKVVAGEVIHIGKIILTKVVEFIRANKNLAAGLVLGLILNYFLSGIPYLGSFLLDLVGPIIIFLSGLYGVSMDTTESGDPKYQSMAAAAIALIRNFMQLVFDIFNAIRDYWNEK